MDSENGKRAFDARQRVVAALLRHPEGLARQTLAGAAQVPPATLGAMLGRGGKSELGAIVVEAKAERAAAGGGPRPNIVRLREALCVAGVEIGHGHVRVGIAGLDGKLLADSNDSRYDEKVMPVFGERRHTLNWIAGGMGEEGALPRRLSDVFEAQVRRGAWPQDERPMVLGVGVSVAGPVDPHDGRLVCARPSRGLPLSAEEGTIACADWDGESAGQGLRDRLRGGDGSERFGWTMSRFRSASAAELCARAELRGGVIEPADLAIFIKWTGTVSAAVMLAGRLVVGARGLAGGFSMHSPRRDGRRNGGGKELPFGAAIGVRRIAKELCKELGIEQWEKDSGVLLRDFFRMQVLGVAHGQAEGFGAEAAARVKAALGEAASALGEVLAPTVEMLDLSKVVVGGGVFRPGDWPLVGEPLSEGMRASLTVPGKTPDVVLAEHSEHPALCGAIASRLDPAEAVPALLRACGATSEYEHVP